MKDAKNAKRPLFLVWTLTLVWLSPLLIDVLDVVRCDVADSIPNVDLMRYGFDISEVDWFPENGGDSGLASKGRYPLFNFTYQRGKVCNIELLQVKWRQPDQVATCWGMPWGSLATDVTISSDVQQHADTQSQHMGISASMPAMAGVSASVSVNIQHSSSFKEMQQKNYTYAEMNLKMTTHAVGLSPGLFKLEDHAQKIVDKLEGKTYESDKDTFDEFFATYGTHFFSKANFGGNLHAHIEVEKTYFSTSQGENFSVDAKAELQTTFGGGGIDAGVSNSNSDSESHLKMHSKMKVFYYGGKSMQPSNESKLNETGMQDWENATRLDPWLVWGDIVPIYEAITTSDAVKYQMKRAMFARVAHRMLTFVRDIFEVSCWKEHLDRQMPGCRLAHCPVSMMYDLLNHSIKRLVPVRQDVADLYKGIMQLVGNGC